MGPATIREARLEDLEAIRVMYNHYVLNSDCTFRIEPQKHEETVRWFKARGPEHPVLVAEREGEVAGWSALSPYLFRCAYRRTVENSVYVRKDLHGQGLGVQLLTALVDRARVVGHHCIIALITSTQSPSLGLHGKLGYERAGYLREVGFKFDRWLDVVIMQRLLS